MYNVDKSVVQQYAIENNVSHKEALEKLRENYEKEVHKVDFKQIALRAIQGMRTMSPKLTGLEQREVESQHRIKTLEAELKKANDNFTTLYNLYNSLVQNVMNSKVEINGLQNKLSGLQDNAENLEDTVKNLEKIKKSSFYTKIKDKVKCLLRIS